MKGSGIDGDGSRLEADNSGNSDVHPPTDIHAVETPQPVVQPEVDSRNSGNSDVPHLNDNSVIDAAQPATSISSGQEDNALGLDARVQGTEYAIDKLQQTYGKLEATMQRADAFHITELAQWETQRIENQRNRENRDNSKIQASQLENQSNLIAGVQTQLEEQNIVSQQLAERIAGTEAKQKKQDTEAKELKEHAAGVQAAQEGQSSHAAQLNQKFAGAETKLEEQGMKLKDINERIKEAEDKLEGQDTKVAQVMKKQDLMMLIGLGILGVGTAGFLFWSGYRIFFGKKRQSNRRRVDKSGSNTATENSPRKGKHKLLMHSDDGHGRRQDQKFAGAQTKLEVQGTKLKDINERIKGGWSQRCSSAGSEICRDSNKVQSTTLKDINERIKGAEVKLKGQDTKVGSSSSEKSRLADRESYAKRKWRTRIIIPEWLGSHGFQCRQIGHGIVITQIRHQMRDWVFAVLLTRLISRASAG